ncbi:POK9 protein, partial [Nyctiprogne leucopyga]|nr:POK9 protein [Nyctiprogne leucopyga]
QLRATVNESGIHGEPARQMLNYIWGGNILLPVDIKSIMRLILTQHQHGNSELRPATSGSLGLDLATAVDCTLIDTKPQRIATGIQGPVMINGQSVGALLIGRSSSTMAGLDIAVGLIDADYTGEIQVMAQTLYPPMYIPAGSCIAQLIPLPQLTKDITPVGSPRGDRALGSTGLMTLLTVELTHWPRRQIKLQYKDQTAILMALLDTGADVTVVATHKWPHHWPTIASNATVAGVGGVTLAQRS